jgi:hypothetical protein
MNDWTVMIYFAGENRLFDEMVYSLKDLKRVNVDKRRRWLSLLAQFSARPVKKDQATGTNLATPRRFDLFTDSDHPAGSVASNYIPPPQSATHGESFIDELVDFIVWGILTRRARKYMVVFAGDGGGVLSEFMPSTIKPPKSIRPRDLSTIFRRVKAAVRRKLNKKIKIDVIGLDSCLMSMTEIGYGLRNYARYLVSSEGNEDDLGWPYSEVFKILNHPRHPVAPETLAIRAVDAYNTYYLDYALIAGASANLSAVNLDQMQNLARAFAAFTRVALPLMPREQKTFPEQIFLALLIHAHWVCQTFRQDQYADVGDFFEQLAVKTNEMIHTHPDLRTPLTPIVLACQKILRALRPANGYPTAVVHSCHVGVKYQYSRGLSIYFPWAKVEETYFQPRNIGGPNSKPPKLEAFALATGWGDFISRYVELSQRPAREGLPEKDLLPGIRDLLRDPPDGRGFLPVDYETAKNPPATWNISGCVIEPLRNS